MEASRVTKIIPGIVHPLAACMKDSHVQIGCTIGARTRVWQFASVIRKAHIGEDCSIAANVIVDASYVGDRCSIEHGASIHPGMEIGNDVFIGPQVVMCNDMWPRATKEGFDIEELLSGKLVTTRIEDGASIGAGALILPGVVIGREAMIAAGAVVSCNVPDAHVYHRSGMIVPIDPKRPAHRMREAVSHG